MNKLGWKESPTQYAKIKGKDIEEKEFECNCDGSWGTGDNQENLFKKRTIYPFNKIYHSESGHLIEIDDNKDSERISINHRTGSFVEFHPNGDRIDKIVRDSYTSILRDSRLHVSGYSEITVDKSLKILVNAEENPNTERESTNFDIHVGKNANINIYVEKGDVNITVDEGNTNTLIKNGNVNLRQEKGNYRHYVNGDYRLHVTGKYETYVGKNRIEHIQGSRATSIGGVLDYLELTNSNGHIETRANKESRILFSDIYIRSKNFVSRAEDQTIMETGANNIGEFTITSAGNVNITSGWDPILRAKSRHRQPRLNLFSYKRSSGGGDVCIFTDNDFNLVSENLTKFDVRGGTFHIKSQIIRTDAKDESNPASALQQQFPKIHIANYSKINYDAIMSNGFQQISIR